MRPDLPLILLVVCGAVAMALWVEGGGPTPAAPGEEDAAAGDPLAGLDAAVLACSSGLGVSNGADAEAPELAAAVEQVSARVERLRELRFRRAVDAEFLTAAELRDHVEGLIAEELPEGETRREADLLKQLGAIPSDTDLYEVATEMLGTQVAGLYDQESEQLLVQSDAGGGNRGAPEGADALGVEEEGVLAHELEHALADQAHGIRDRASSVAAQDRELAYIAVVEGDATLATQHYVLAHVGFAEQLAVAGGVPGARAVAELPDYLRRSLLFPYVEGLRLTCHRFLAGGWRAVDRLYAKPPLTTAQVIFPARYGEGPAQAVPALGDPGPGWSSVVRRQLGAAELEWLFLAPGGDPEAALPDARQLVFGWAGGEVELWKRGSERALAIALAELEETDTLCGALAAWYRAGWPDAEVQPGAAPVELEFSEPGRSAVLACEGDEIRLGIAPDPATAARLAA